MTMRAALTACLSAGTIATGVAAQEAPLRPSFLITSPTYREFAFIDKRSAAAERQCGGQNLSPALTWSGEPATTKSFAILFQDPDGARGQGEGKWIGYDIPANVHAIEEGGMTRNSLKATLGVNDHKEAAYYGPCPPYGTFHHYVYGVYALDLPAGTLKPGLNREEFLAAIKGHTTAYQSIVFVYQRRRPANGASDEPPASRRAKPAE